MYRRRRQLSGAEKEANARERAEREAAAMTCQICSRKILANTGVVAHHGYNRPGDGWQTDSCGGARDLPFEMDRTALGTEIVMAEIRLKSAEEFYGQTEREEIDIVFERREYAGYMKPDIVHRFVLNRVNFDEIKNTNSNIFFRYTALRDFDAIKELELHTQKLNVSLIANYVKSQKERYAGWKQTHHWTGKWERLP